MVSARIALPAALALAACVPPAGLGAGPVTVPDDGGSVAGVVGSGASTERETFQAEGSLVARPARHFAIETGVAYTLMRVETDRGELIAHSAMPYARPTLVLGRAQVGVALSGFGMGGGGGGFYYGLLGVRAGYGTDRWSAYAEWMVHGSNLTSEDPIDSSSRQLRAGGDYEWDLGDTGRLGVALELADIDERFEADDHEFDERHVGVILKVRIRGVFDRL